MSELTLASLAVAEHLSISYLTRTFLSLFYFYFLPFVVQIFQIVPLRRHLRRGAVTLLLFEVPANIFHGSEVKFYSGLKSVVEFSANVK